MAIIFLPDGYSAHLNAIDGMKMMNGEDVVGDIPALSLIVGFLAAFVWVAGLQVDD